MNAAQMEAQLVELAKTRGEAARKTIDRLAAERLVLLVEKEQLQIKFEASQAALGVAVTALDRVTGERDRARDLAVRSGVFTRRDDAHSLADLPDWEND